MTLTTTSFWIGEGSETFERIVHQFSRETGIAVKPIGSPESGATETLATYTELLNRGASAPDVCHIDVTSAGILAEHLIDLTRHLEAESKLHVPAIVQNNTVEGRLVGMPFHTDVGLLFYRTDLLRKYGFHAPPRTWDELESMAATIQAGERAAGDTRFWGFVWQGAAYEGLTCNALEWQVSHGGGSIIEPSRRITVRNPRTLKALKKAARWVGTISPPGVTAYKEEDARNVWQSGKAAFMRNWPYAYGRGQSEDSAVRGRFDVAVLPSGGARHASALGGWQFAVSRYSTQTREAVAFIRYMTSREIQRRRAVEGSYLPTIPDLYDDPEVLKANPFYARLKDVFLRGAIARPSTVTGSSYGEVSQAYFTAVHSVLTGQTPAETALAGLEARLGKITGFPTGPP